MYYIPDFDTCYKKYFPNDADTFTMEISVGEFEYSIERFTKILIDERVKNGLIDFIELNVSRPFYAAIIMHAAYGHYKCDLEKMLKKFNGTNEFNNEMRKIALLVKTCT
ncbi:MAG: hypothetical protein LKI76_03820 [Megasphaera sp.]|jgi:hypothetical protein|uniref:hypothetical protein n=1 Tax=Megasphaera sueciensis TaxID=349094 RepID=UPI003D0103CA|nr:hypothetical protein [Megasphaera sp.]MCI1823051.1 hypothetical protein [Megasphaera sp.]